VPPSGHGSLAGRKEFDDDQVAAHERIVAAAGDVAANEGDVVGRALARVRQHRITSL